MKRFHATLLLVLVLIVATQTTLATYDGLRFSQSTYVLTNTSYINISGLPLNNTYFTVVMWTSVYGNISGEEIFAYTNIRGQIRPQGGTSSQGLRLQCSNCDDTFLSGTQSTLNFNQTYMAGFVRSATNLTVYLDGAYLGSDDSNQTSGQVNSGAFIIGDNPLPSPKVNIYMVQIYNRPLTDAEFSMLYQRGYLTISNITDSLLAQYVLNNSDNMPYGNSTHVYDITTWSNPINATINFSNSLKTINFTYGLQDDGDSYATVFQLPTALGSAYKNATGTGWNRIWLRNQGANQGGFSGEYWVENMPLLPNGVYDYTNLTAQVNWTLNLGMKVRLTFSNVPQQYANFTASACSQAYPNLTFYDDNANYTANVVEFLRDAYEQGNLTNIGEFSDVFEFSLWNEPFCQVSSSLRDDYTIQQQYQYYWNQTYPTVKARVPEATVGTAGDIIGYPWNTTRITNFYCSLNSSMQPDVVSFHLYDNGGYGTPADQEERFLSETRVQYKSLVDNLTSTVHACLPNVKIVNDEYTFSANTSIDYGFSKVGSSWMASSLYWQLQTNLTGEYFYRGVDYIRQPGSTQISYGIMQANTTALHYFKPEYYIREAIVNRFLTGKDLIIATPTNSQIVEIMATKNNNSASITLNNKVNQPLIIPLNITDINFISIRNTSLSSLTSTNGLYYVSLSGLETQTLDLELFNQILYVNSSHGSCSDNYNRAQASSPSTPWCGANTTWLYQPESGDTVLVYNISREPNGNGWVVSNKDLTNVTFIYDNNVVLTSAFTKLENNGDCTWTNYANNSDGARLWSTTCISTSSTFIGVTKKNNSIGFLNTPSVTNLSQNFWPNYSSFWNSTPDVLYLKLPYNENPNNGGLIVSKAPVFTFTNVDGATFINGTCEVGTYCIQTTSGTNGFNWTGFNVRGGTNDNGVMRFTSATDIHFDNYTIIRADREQYGDYWNLIKPETTNTEVSAIKFDTVTRGTVTNGNVSGYFNGIVIVSSTNITIKNNYCDWTMDDCLEPEGTVSNLKFIQNTCAYNVYVCFSASPAYSNSSQSNLSFNVMRNNRSENTYNNTGSKTSGRNIKIDDALGWVNWVVHNNNFMYQEGQDCSGTFNNQANVTNYNNLYYTNSNRNLGCTGLQTDNNNYDYNLYYRSDGGEIARYINSSTNSTGVSSLSALQAAMTAWNVNSVSGNPLFYDEANLNFSLIGNSPAATSGLYGGFIGAFPALSSTTPSISGLTVSTTATTMTVEWNTNVAANYTLNYGINASNLSSSTSNSNLATSRSVQLISLVPQTTYYFNITISDGFGLYATNGTYSATTKAQVCDATSIEVLALVGIVYILGILYFLFGIFELTQGSMPNLLLFGVNGVLLIVTAPVIINLLSGACV